MDNRFAKIQSCWDDTHINYSKPAGSATEKWAWAMRDYRVLTQMIVAEGNTLLGHDMEKVARKIQKHIDRSQRSPKFDVREARSLYNLFSKGKI